MQVALARRRKSQFPCPLAAFARVNAFPVCTHTQHTHTHTVPFGFSILRAVEMVVVSDKVLRSRPNLPSMLNGASFNLEFVPDR